MFDMINFYLNDIIFIINEWGCVMICCDFSDEEEDVILIWKKFKLYLRYKWLYVKEKSIFRINCIYVIICLLGYI